MKLNPDACYRALAARDARFDGRLFVAVHNGRSARRARPSARTSLFIRRPAPPRRPASGPVCAVGPNARPTWRCGAAPPTRCRALALIADGALDQAAVDALAARLGVGERQLRRLFKQHLGASPIAVAQTRRVLFAKQLIVETTLPMTEIALAPARSRYTIDLLLPNRTSVGVLTSDAIGGKADVEQAARNKPNL
jgi:AraC family transcriptional regulator, regulatory protein of adaptative response / DNA-3-methyladenine glycosylase II